MLYKEQVQAQLALVERKAEEARKAEELQKQLQGRYIDSTLAAQLFLQEQKQKEEEERKEEERKAKQAKKDAAAFKYYRGLLVDKNNMLPNRDVVVSAKTKEEAKEAIRSILHAEAVEELHRITEGNQQHSVLVTSKEGIHSRATLVNVSVEYYWEHVSACWAIEELEIVTDTNKSVTPDASAKIAAKGKKKNRWSRAQKNAAKRARAIA